MAQRIELSALEPQYDLVIVGGGITGAGIFHEAVRSGARVLLVDVRDFASGTSSWSSKLVHGGLRYLKNGQWRLTLESVRERQRLLDQAPGLIDVQQFMMPIYAGRKPGRWLMQVGLWIYDLMAGKRRSFWMSADRVLQAEPSLPVQGLKGALVYEDARTDDARLVLRLVFEAESAGGVALNYTRAALRRDADGRVCGVSLDDQVTGQVRDIDAGMVVNATGAWAAAVDAPGGHAPPLRPLRGSHLVFPLERLPIERAIAWLHPRDERPVFAYPWEGAVLYGTTDVDHEDALSEPRITASEVGYLVEGLQARFPDLALRAEDAICSYAGVRPVVAGGKADPSAESRESAMWSEPGLIGITGGKLTTFRVTARQVLQEAARQLPKLAPGKVRPVFEREARAAPDRLSGRLGSSACTQLRVEGSADGMQSIEGTPYTWAEVEWSLRHERVVHLGDLMMRRTRLGLVLPRGGEAVLTRMIERCAQILGWDVGRCEQELSDYRAYWQAQHAPPSA